MNNQIPGALKVWFIIHFIVDVLFALPLMIIPGIFLAFLGWQNIDVISARIIAAALFGIGLESFIGRNAGRQAYKGMLNLKIIWSFSVITGVIISMFQGAQGRPLFGWILLGIFIP